jgi:hypothetical protein
MRGPGPKWFERTADHLSKQAAESAETTNRKDGPPRPCTGSALKGRQAPPVKAGAA